MGALGKVFEVGSITYTVTELLSQGGFGLVFRADPDAAHAPPLIVKTPADHVLGDEDWLRRFKREARILGNVRHPNIVKTMGLLEYEDSTLLLTQEMVRDATELFGWAYCGDEDSNFQLLSIALQVLYGLRQSHGLSDESRAIHRDLSPRNILVDSEGLAVIIDFGLAKEDPRGSTVLTVTGDVFGTPGCMAPEQRQKTADVDHRADLYAFGRSIGSCIQGRHPEHVDGSTLPEPWKSVLGRCTEYSRNDRPESAVAVVGMLLEAMPDPGFLFFVPRRHFEELGSWETAPAAWPRIAAEYFDDDLVTDDLELAYTIRKAVLDDSGFRADEAFWTLHEHVIEPEFVYGQPPFEDCDPLGEMICRWMPFLEPELRVMAFRSLVRIARQFHRYSVMEDVRIAFKTEDSSDLREAFLKVLNEVDPNGVIQSRGIIPR